MVNRRQFIGAGTAASAAAALAAASPARAHGIVEPLLAGVGLPEQPPPAAGLPPVRAALFDERFDAGRRFGATMQRRGVEVHAIRSDATRVWYDRLHPLWRQAPAPVAGLTAYAAMFCLERLAWDHGLRMIQRAPRGTDPPLYSWVIAAPGADFAAALAAWSRQ